MYSPFFFLPALFYYFFSLSFLFRFPFPFFKRLSLGSGPDLWWYSHCLSKSPRPEVNKKKPKEVSDTAWIVSFKP